MGDASFAKEMPRLVYATVRGFGPTGPYSRIQGCELIPALDRLDESAAQDVAGGTSPVAKILDEAFAQSSAAAWQERLLAADVGCVPVAEVPLEEVLLDNLLSTEVDTPSKWSTRRGPSTRFKPLDRLSRSETVAAPGVLCGQSTEAIPEETP